MGYVELVFRREGRFLRWCARKRLHEQFRSDPTFRSMFMDEARLAGLVHHPNAVGVLDVGEDEDGPFLIMDFVEGVSLAKLIADAVHAGRSIPMQVAVRICLDAASGLHAAHEVRAEDGTVLHLVHRDVSPQNILIGFDGTVRVTDFGIAKALGNSSRTSAGVLKGNMGYLSPEQLRFEEPDRRSDFFSLGVTLYELLSGLRLYPNKDGFDGTRRILTEPPPDIGEVRGDVPPELCELLFELLAKQRDSRPATAVEIAGRLEGVLAPLIAEEGSVTVGDYMNQHFAPQCQEQRATLTEHLKRIESDPVPTLRALPAVSQPIAGTERGKSSRMRRAAVAVLVFGVFGAVVAAASLQLRGREQPSIVAPLPLPPTPRSETAPLLPASADNPARAGAASSTAVLPARAVVPKTPSRLTQAAGPGKERRKPPKRTPRPGRARAAAADRAAPAPVRNSPEPTHLAVPLFDRWQ